MDHGITMASDGMAAKIPKSVMMRILDDHPAIARALLWTTLVDEGVLREWLVNIGGRDAYARLAHLLCELYVRLENVGLVDGFSYAFPLTQEQLGDALGLTPVHVNRTMRLLREAALVSITDHVLTIHDFETLKRVGDFDHAYLHGKPRSDASGLSW